MLAIPLVRSFWGQPFLRFFREAGAPVDRYLEEARLAPDVDQEPGQALPSRPLYWIIDRLARESGRRDVGLEIGARTRIRSLGPFGRRIAGRETLGDAIAAAERLMPSVHTARQVTLSVAGGAARLSSRLDPAQLAPTPWGDQFALSMLIDLVRMASGSDWCPERATVQARPDRGGPSGSALGGATVDHGETATTIEFPRSLLGCRLGTTSGQAFDRGAVRHPDVDLEPLPTDFVGSLQVTLDALLPQGHTDIGSLARMVDLSVRTLQRRLSARGWSFSELLARSRFGLARRRLLDPSVRVIDVAFEAGYSDHTHFTAAFRRWTGQTPVVYRTAQASALAQAY